MSDPADLRVKILSAELEKIRRDLAYARAAEANLREHLERTVNERNELLDRIEKLMEELKQVRALAANGLLDDLRSLQGGP